MTLRVWGDELLVDGARLIQVIGISKTVEEFIDCPLCLSPPDAHKLLVTVPIEKRGWPGSDRCIVRICSQCGLAFVSPRLSQEGYNRYYAQTYYEGLASREIARVTQYNENIAKRVLNVVAQHLNLKKSAHMDVLDVGCGYGELLNEVRKRYGASVTGVEVSHSAARFAREMYKIEVIEQDINQNFGIGNRYDLVFLIATLEHVRDPHLVLNGLTGLMRDGGSLIVLVPDLRGIRRRVTTEKLQKVFKGVHTVYFSRSTIQALLHRCKLEEKFITSGYYSSNNQNDILLVARKNSAVSYGGEQADDWQEVVKYVRGTVRRNDLIAHAEDLAGINLLRKFVRKIRPHPSR